MVRKLPQVIRKQAIYGTHRKLIEMISAQMKQSKSDIEYEQLILSGVHSEPPLKPISDKEMFTLVKKRIESNPSQAARLLCILVSCYSVPEREFTRLSQILKSPTKEMVN